MEFLLSLKDKLTGPAHGASAALGELQGKLHGVGAESEKAEGFLGSLTGKVGLGVAFGNALTAVGEQALEMGKRVAEAAVEVAKFAIETADAHKDLLLTLEIMTGSSVAAEELAGQMDRLAATGLTTEETIEGFGKSLALAGLEGDALSETLENLTGVSSVSKDAAASLQGLIEKTQASGKFEPLAKSLKGTGISMGELAAHAGMTMKKFEEAIKKGSINSVQGLQLLNKAISDRYAGPIQKKTALISSQLRAFKHDIGELFEDINLAPLSDGLRQILALFDQNTESGKAMKAVITGFFESLASLIGSAAPLVKVFLQGMIIAVLELYIAFQPMIDSLREFLGLTPDDSLLDFVKWLGMAVVGTTVAVAAFTAVLAALLAGPLLLLGVGAKLAASDFVAGLVDGIAAGAGRIVATVRGIAQSAIGAFKSTLGISSPSKVMEQMGHFTAHGFARGVAANENAATGAMEGLASASVTGATPARASTPSGDSGTTINLGSVTFTITASDAADVKKQVEAQWGSWIEQLALQMGALRRVS